jgi:hypothetical protein
MLRPWVKILPFFVVCWLARKYCERQRVNNWIYVQPFGPGKMHKPQANVLIEVDVANREGWYK